MCSAPRAGEGRLEPVPATWRDMSGGKRTGSPEGVETGRRPEADPGFGSLGGAEEAEASREEEEEEERKSAPDDRLPPEEESSLGAPGAPFGGCGRVRGDGSTSIAFGCGSGAGAGRGCCFRTGGDGGFEVAVEVGKGAEGILTAAGGGGEGAGAVDRR